jgi:hypothetical protein
MGDFFSGGVLEPTLLSGERRGSGGISRKRIAIGAKRCGASREGQESARAARSYRHNYLGSFLLAERSFLASRMSCSRPVASLFRMRSLLDMTAAWISLSISPSIRFSQASSKVTPSMCCKMSIRAGGWPIWKVLPSIKSAGVRSTRVHRAEQGREIQLWRSARPAE